jgi:hypothetical protein
MINRIFGTFTLLGHDNPLGSYPAPVVPIGAFNGRSVAVYAKRFWCRRVPINEDTEFVRYVQRPKTLGTFDHKRHRMFAFSASDVRCYAIAEESKFFLRHLSAGTLVEADSFFRLACAEATSDRRVIVHELAACVSELESRVPHALTSWYKQEYARLSAFSKLGQQLRGSGVRIPPTPMEAVAESLLDLEPRSSGYALTGNPLFSSRLLNGQTLSQALESLALSEAQRRNLLELWLTQIILPLEVIAQTDRLRKLTRTGLVTISALWFAIYVIRSLYESAMLSVAANIWSLVGSALAIYLMLSLSKAEAEKQLSIKRQIYKRVWEIWQFIRLSGTYQKWESHSRAYEFFVLKLREL